MKRRYTIRLHGLLCPESVTVNGRKLAKSDASGQGEGWTWDGQSRVTTIRLAKPISTTSETTVLVQGAGTYADALVLQKALNLRAQIRQAKREMKFKHSELLNGGDVKKMPRVLERSEEIERRLTAIINSPKSGGKTPPDFDALRQRVLDALTDGPFNYDRIIPDVEPESSASAKRTENAVFTPDEISRIKLLIPGADVPARLWHQVIR